MTNFDAPQYWIMQVLLKLIPQELDVVKLLVVIFIDVAIGLIVVRFSKSKPPTA